MRATSFGRMARLHLPVQLMRKCEVMHFETIGKPHRHDRPEIAIAVAGSGIVWVGDIGHRVQAGDHVWIPADASHHMQPDDGQVLAMLIGYALDPGGE